MNALLDTIDSPLFEHRREGILSPSSRESFVARSLASSHIVTSSTKNDERRSFRLGYRDCYSTASATTYFWHRRPTLLFVKRIARSSASARIWETQNYVGFILTDESLLSSWPPYPLLPSPFPITPRPPLLVQHPSFRSRARVTIPREPVIFTPKWPVSSNWTTIIRTIAARIIATIMGRITAPEVISLIVKDCPCPCLRRGRW